MVFVQDLGICVCAVNLGEEVECEKIVKKGIELYEIGAKQCCPPGSTRSKAKPHPFYPPAPPLPPTRLNKSIGNTSQGDSNHGLAGQVNNLKKRK